MVGTFLEKVGGWFDRRFLVAYWSPVFVSLGAIGGLVVLILGPPVVFGWWTKLNGEEQIVIGVGSLVATSLLGLGVQLDTGSVTAATLREAVERVANDPQYRKRAQDMQQVTRDAGGYQRAADAIIQFTQELARQA